MPRPVEQGLCAGNGERLGIGKLGVFLELDCQSSVDGLELMIQSQTSAVRIASAALASARPDRGQRRLTRPGGGRRRYWRWRTSCGKRSRALGEAHRHLRQRISCTGLQRPLCQLEAFLARFCAIGIGAIDGPS